MVNSSIDGLGHGVGSQHGAGSEHILPERLEPVELPKSYYISGLVTLLGLFVLLAGYLMLTVGLLGGYVLLLRHALVNDLMSGSWEWTFWLFLFGGPLLLILVYFMVLPLFSRRGLRPRYVTLTEQSQGRFFVFLKRLCSSMDAALPDEVVLDSRANASVRRISPLRSREQLQLVIGTPLVEGLSALQLAGIIAHELAHFRQKGGRRLNYAIESIGNLLELLAFDRNSRSARILSEKFRITEGLIAKAFYGCAIAMVGAARKICQGMAWLGRLISSHHSRQLEFDADRWQARLVGNVHFAELMREMALLDFACHRSLSSMSEHEEEDRFPVDIADYGMAFRSMLDEEVEEQIWTNVLQFETGRFDSHPSAQDRIDNVSSFTRSPSAELDHPARDLFRNWRDVSRLTTRVFYCQVLGEPVFPQNLFTSEELLGNLERKNELDLAHVRYYAGVWPWLRPVRLGVLIDYVTGEIAKKPHVDLAAAARRQLGVQREILQREAAQADEQRGLFMEGIGRLARGRSAEHLCAAGAVEVLRRNELAVDTQLHVQDQQAAIRQTRRAEQALSAFEHAVSFRLALALAGPGEGRIAELRAQAQPLITFLRALEAENERLRGIVVEHSVLRTIENLGDEYHVPNEYLERRRKLAWGLMSRLKQLYFNLEDVAYPVDDERMVSVSSWFLQIPEENIDSILHSSSVLMDNLPGAVFRVLGRLAQLAEEIEKESGLPLLDLTPEFPEEEVPEEA